MLSTLANFVINMPQSMAHLFGTMAVTRMPLRKMCRILAL
jgi:hypothetical protein